jgi:large subunit ribosomal protein L24
MTGRKSRDSGQAHMKIKKGDHVIVIAGKDRGREGTVIKVRPDRQQVLVQGVNMIRKNTKVNYQSQRGLRDSKEGGIVTQEAMIHVSNVQLVDPDSKKPAKAGYRSQDNSNDGTVKKVRFSRASGKEF